MCNMCALDRRVRYVLTAEHNSVMFQEFNIVATRRQQTAFILIFFTHELVKLLGLHTVTL